MWWHDGMGWGGWIAMTLLMVGFWSLVIVVVMAIFRADREDRRDQAPRRRDAEQILDERFARGEIEIEEYHARQDALRAGH